MKSMKGIPKFSVALLTFAFGVIAAMAWISYQPSISKKVATYINPQTNVESNLAKEEPKSENEDTGCLSAEQPKRKTMVYAGVLNVKAIDIPKPEYPAEAKAAKISGEVKVSAVVDETGAVIWARVNTGHPLLQAAVKKVVCQARFKPATISGHPVTVSGIITYKFVLP